MILTFCNYKGGTGKTTISLAVALTFDAIGRRVAILDKDPQQSATDAVQDLKAQDLCNIEVIDSIRENRDRFDLIIVDTAPRLDNNLTRAVIDTDRVVVVVGQSPNDLKSTQKLIDFIAPSVLPEVRPRLLFNQVQPNTNLGKLVDVVAEKMGIGRYNSIIKHSVAFQSLPLVGLDALSPDHKAQLKDVVLEIMSS